MRVVKQLRIFAFLGWGGLAGTAQAVCTFGSSGEPSLQRGSALGTQLGLTDAILAYEDLVHGDNVFQDFVVLVRGVKQIPLPAAGWLLCSALAGLATRKRFPHLLA